METDFRKNLERTMTAPLPPMFRRNEDGTLSFIDADEPLHDDDDGVE
jgi:hypothetical protein